DNTPWTVKFSKIKAVVNDLDKLICRIEADHKNHKIPEESLPIDFFTGGNSIAGVNGQFVFFQVLIDCLIQLKSTQADKDDLINYCKNEYKDDKFELKNLGEFEKFYSPEKALYWYSRESFFFKTLNTALRSKDIHLIFLFRTYIADIYRQLVHYQAANSLKVYRCQKISKSELNNLKRRVGQLISVNSFLSTSADKTSALNFIKDVKATDKIDRLLFEIDVDHKMAATKPFADISAHCEFPDESEILFMLGSIFRLTAIDRSESDQVSIVKMTLCSENAHDLKQILLYIKQQLGSGETNLRTLGKVLWKMGEFDLAEQYFTRLLKEAPPNDDLLGTLYEDLALLASQTRDYMKSVQWYEKSLKLKNSKRPDDTEDVKKPINNRGKFIESL
ncbi:unnamed protein product, partial [Rotaria sp. Silwood2]